MRRVIIESPLKAHTHDGVSYTFEDNVAYARQALRDSLDRGEAPYASHLLYPQVYDDANDEQRRHGMEAGWAWMTRAELVAVYADHGITSGMARGIAHAEANGIEIVYRALCGVQ